MPQCVAYGCIPKVRAAAEGNGKKISYYKIPQKKPVEESMGIKNPMFKSGAQ